MKFQLKYNSWKTRLQNNAHKREYKSLFKLKETYSRRICKQNRILLLREYDQLQQPIEDYILARVKDQTQLMLKFFFLYQQKGVREREREQNL